MRIGGMRIGGPWPDKNEGYEFTDHVKRASEGKDVLSYYSDAYAASGSRAEWADRIAAGLVHVNGDNVSASTTLHCNDVLTYRRAPWREPDSPNYVDIIYQDQHLLVANKPSGLQVLPAAMFHQRTVLGLLTQHFLSSSSLSPSTKLAHPATHGGDHAPVPAPVHRLGRGTSGVLICATTPLARKALTAAFAAKTQRLVAEAEAGAAALSQGTQHHQALPSEQQCEAEAGQPAHRIAGAAADSDTPASSSAASAAALSAAAAAAAATPRAAPAVMRKIYRALVQGLVKEQEQDVNVPIGPVPYPGVDGGLFAASPQGKPARSICRVLEHRTDQDCTLLEVEIFSGRPHQIRIHTAAMGHPLVGDPLYGPGGCPKPGLSALDRLDEDALSGRASTASPQGAAAEPTTTASPHQGRQADPAGGGAADPDPAGGGGAADPDPAGGGGAVGSARRPGALPGDCGYLLHCHIMTITHPATLQPLTLVAPPPPELLTAEEAKETPTTHLS